MAILGLNTNRLGAVTGQILRRVIVVFGLSYLFWLVFYLDFLKKSIESVAGLIEPSAITSVPLLITGIAVAVALIVTAATLWVSERAFVRGVVSACAVLNLSTIVSIGLKSPLAWLSLVISIAALFSVWRLPAKRVMGVVFLAGVIVTGYALVDQAVWVWAHRAEPEPEPAQVAPPPATTDGQLPSVYIVVMDELPLSIVNEYTSFMSLPNLSRLAQEGIFFPRAYTISDTTEWSIPSFFTGSYLEQDQTAGRASHLALTNYRNLVTDLANLGYQVKVFNDLFGISYKVPCSPLKVEMEGGAVIACDDLTTFAVKHLVRQITFGLRPASNIGSFLHDQPARVFYLEHQSDHPQLVYFHLFDTHRDWIRNRDGSFHHSPYTCFVDPWDESAAAKVSENMFEQVLWADNITGQLVDSLLAIPEEERIVVLLSDHGVSWREPPFGRETGYLRTTQVHVPVVLVAPDLPPEINTDLLPVIDIYPTIVDLLNKAAGQTVLTSPENIDGLSLFGDFALRQNRPHYVFSASSKYRLAEDKWVLEKVLQTGSTTGWQWPDFPSLAQELALTPEAVQHAMEEATNLQPIPPMDPQRMRSIERPANPWLFLVYHDYQIFLYEDRYYAVRQDEAKDAPRRLRADDFTNMIEGTSLDDVKQKIDALPLEVQMPVTVDEAYRGYQIVCLQNRYYSIPQGLAFNLEQLRAGNYIEGASLKEVRQAIDNYLAQLVGNAILPMEHKGFMFITAEGTIYGFPKPDTPLESIEVYLERIKADEIYPVYTGKTVEEVTSAIDSDPYVGGSGDTLVFVEEGYKGFNIIANKGTLYAILQADGRFGYERLKSGPYTVLVEGRTLAEVKQAIDDYLEE